MTSLITKFLSRITHLAHEKECSYNAGYWAGYRKGHTEGHAEGHAEGVEDLQRLLSLESKRKRKNCLKCQAPFESYICQNRKYCSKKCGIESGVFHGKARRKKKVAVEEIAEIATEVPEEVKPPIVEEVIKIPLFPPAPSSQYQTMEQKKARLKAFSQW